MTSPINMFGIPRDKKPVPTPVLSDPATWPSGLAPRIHRYCQICDRTVSGKPGDTPVPVFCVPCALEEGIDMDDETRERIVRWNADLREHKVAK